MVSVPRICMRGLQSDVTCFEFRLVAFVLAGSTTEGCISHVLNRRVHLVCTRDAGSTIFTAEPYNVILIFQIPRIWSVSHFHSWVRLGALIYVRSWCGGWLQQGVLWLSSFRPSK